MNYTTNYNLKKPEDNDNVLISDLNGNADAVDTALHALDEGVKGAQGSLAAAPEKQSLADGDGVVVTDSAAGNSAKRVLWSTVKTVLAQLFAPLTHKHAAGDVTSGTFDVARIPGLAASKITSGILPVVRGGTGVSSLVALAAALHMPNIKVGYYTGTGGYGASSPCSVSADFEVKLLILVAIQEEAYMHRPESLLKSSRPIMLTDGVPATEFRSYAGPFYDGSSEYTNGKVSADKKTLYWYNESSAYRQFNQANTRYHYLLFG